MISERLLLALTPHSDSSKMNQAEIHKLISALKFKVQPKPFKIKTMIGERSRLVTEYNYCKEREETNCERRGHKLRKDTTQIVKLS